jgi:hypothetical protein
MLLSFPYMHPECVPGALVPGLSFFDPGLAGEPGEHAFKPEGLPLDAKTATALIRDSISFGEQFKDPGEMAFFGVMTPDDFYEGSPSSIKAQLMQRLSEGQGGGADRVAVEARARAQFTLLLAWAFEERMLEVLNLEQGVRDSWKSMDTTLGLDDEDRTEERVLTLGNAQSHTGGASDGQHIALPWERIIEALPTFLPRDAVLVCAVPEIIATWQDIGIAFGPADAALGLPEGSRMATAPAWRLAGRRKMPDTLPDSARDLSVAIIS